MRRARLALVLAAAISATAGCTIVSHGAELPSAEERSDAEHADPFSEINQPLRGR